MSELKTKKNENDVKAFVESLDHKKRREDSLKLLEIMNEVTKEDPSMWGDSIIGYGSYHYKTKSGREGDWFVTGFSPRKQSLSVYIMPGLHPFDEELKRLGKHKVGKGCLYINKLEDVEIDVLKEIIEKSFDAMRAKDFRIEV